MVLLRDLFWDQHFLDLVSSPCAVGRKHGISVYADDTLLYVAVCPSDKGLTDALLRCILCHTTFTAQTELHDELNH